MLVICLGPACLTNDSALPVVRVVPDAVLEETKRVRSSLRPARREDDGYAGTVGGARSPGDGLAGEPDAVDVEAATSRTGGAVVDGGGGNCASMCDDSSDMRVKSVVSERVASSDRRVAWEERVIAMEGLRGLETTRCFPRAVLDIRFDNATDVLRL